MSISFEEPMNEDAIRMLKELVGEPDVMDERNALFSKMPTIDRREFTNIANAAKQPVEVQLHNLGDIKELSDGTQYACTKKGWRRLATKK